MDSSLTLIAIITVTVATVAFITITNWPPGKRLTANWATHQCSIRPCGADV